MSHAAPSVVDVVVACLWEANPRSGKGRCPSQSRRAKEAERRRRRRRRRHAVASPALHGRGAMRRTPCPVCLSVGTSEMNAWLLLLLLLLCPRSGREQGPTDRYRAMHDRRTDRRATGAGPSPAGRPSPSQRLARTRSQRGGDETRVGSSRPSANRERRNHCVPATPGATAWCAHGAMIPLDSTHGPAVLCPMPRRGEGAECRNRRSRCRWLVSSWLPLPVCRSSSRGDPTATQQDDAGSEPLRIVGPTPAGVT